MATASILGPDWRRRTETRTVVSFAAGGELEIISWPGLGAVVWGGVAVGGWGWRARGSGVAA